MTIYVTKFLAKSGIFEVDDRFVSFYRDGHVTLTDQYGEKQWLEDGQWHRTKAEAVRAAVEYGMKRIKKLEGSLARAKKTVPSKITTWPKTRR